MPNNNNENNDASIDERGIQRSEALLAGLFGEGGSEESGLPKGKAEEAPEEKPEEESPIEEEESPEEEIEEESSEEEEVDWEADLKPAKESDDAEPKNESEARKQAKIKGREAKELRAKLTERELELDNLKKEKDELAARVQEVEAVKLRPEDHEEYRELRSAVLSDVTDASDLLTIPDPTIVPREFGNFMADYLNMVSLEGADRVQARTKLAGTIVDKLKLSDVPYEDLDEDEKRTHASTVNEVLKIVQRNVGKTKELQKMHADLSDKAKNGKLSVGVRSYENTVKEFKPVLDAVGDLAEDIIDANPYAVESVVAKMVKSSPQAAKRLEKARADVLEAIVGPRALTQVEINRLEANGTDLKVFTAERQKAHRAKQQKLAAYFVQGLMTRSLVKEMATKLAKYEKDNEEEESEFDAVRSATKKSTKVKDAPVRPKDRPSPLVSILGFDAED